MPIYRKGEGQLDDDGRHTELRSAANQQLTEEAGANRGKSAAELHLRDVASGLQGARNAINLGVTVAEATEHPDTLGGPVSGSAMARLKDIKAEKKRTAAREMKRR
jgi:hypothetical protein